MSVPGNDFNVKFKTPEERQKLGEDWCEHLRNGYSKESFPPCDPQTFKRYLKEFPEDFDTDMIEKAERKSRMYWEGIGHDGTIGQIERFNASSWKFNMVNRFGWHEKNDVTTNGKELPQPIFNGLSIKNNDSDE